jgi:hypothetical protein
MPSLTASDAATLATQNSPQLLILAATDDSIASGGDYITFDQIVHHFGFSGVTSLGDSVVWPINAVGEVQVEWEWNAYNGGGIVEIEVDGVVPAWGLVGSDTAGSVGVKRRSVHISEGAIVKIKVTQTSGGPLTGSAFVEFVIPGASLSSRTATLISDVIAARPASPTGETFFDQTFDVVWDGSAQMLISGSPDGVDPWLVEDALRLNVTHADASTASYYVESWLPSGPIWQAPYDISSLLEPGPNTLRVRFEDVYGGDVGNHAQMWLVSA